MTIKYLINDTVVFYPDEHRLVNKQDTKVDLLLNIPASRCLALLIERKGCVITQKEFFEQVWESQGTYVTQNTFYQNISLLRKGLKAAGLTEDPIKTVLKRGMTLAETITVTPFTEPPRVITIGTPQETSTNAPDLPATTPWKNKWPCLLLLTLFAIFSSRYYLEREADQDFFVNYKHYTDIGSCMIMIPNEATITDIYNSFLTANPPTCTENSVIYLTAERDVPRVSKIQCTKDIHSLETKCHSSAYVMD